MSLASDQVTWSPKFVQCQRLLHSWGGEKRNKNRQCQPIICDNTNISVTTSSWAEFSVSVSISSVGQKLARNFGFKPTPQNKRKKRKKKNENPLALSHKNNNEQDTRHGPKNVQQFLLYLYFFFLAFVLWLSCSLSTLFCFCWHSALIAGLHCADCACPYLPNDLLTLGLKIY